MSILVTIIIGGIVGWIASMVMKTDSQMGIIWNVVVGVVGSGIGSWLAGFLGIDPSGSIVRWLVAIAGAVLLIAILKALKIMK